MDARWKDGLTDRALQRFYRPINLMKLVYGDKLSAVKIVKAPVLEDMTEANQRVR